MKRVNDLKRCAQIMSERSKIDPLTWCWEFQGCSNQEGYGHIRCDGVMRKVHHISYINIFGSIPEGLHVLHKCDNPKCWNPSHLRVGTNYDNIIEKMQRYRSGKKLNIAKVLEIKKRLLDGESQDSIAASFCVRQTTISRINTGFNWSHVTISTTGQRAVSGLK